MRTNQFHINHPAKTRVVLCRYFCVGKIRPILFLHTGFLPDIILNNLDINDVTE